MKKYPYLGFGLGLRTPHIERILDTLPPVDWFEILTENFLVPGGRAHYYLDKICEHYPVVMHGVSMSIGSYDPLDFDYLKKVKILAARCQAKWISDHLCWTEIGGAKLHDLMPLPYTEAVIRHVVDRIKQVQDFLGRRILLENVSSYVTYRDSVMPEWEFYKEIVGRSDCLMLLDLNNIYVSAMNHGFSAEEYLQSIPVERVQQFHLAGHSQQKSCLVDTHDHAVCEAVWGLYRQAVKRFGRVSTMIERDARIPPLEELLAELAQAKEIARKLELERAVAV